MKKILLICLIVISTNNLWSQNIYELDSIISVNISGDDIKIDSLKNDKLKIQIYSKVGSSEYLAQKSQYENDSIKTYDSKLPYDLKSLEKLYKLFASDFAKNALLKLDSEKLIEKDSCSGYHLKLSDSINNSIYEVEYFLLDKNIYLFKYNTTTELDNDKKELFFNSIKINSDKKVNQFLGRAPFEKSAYNLGYKIGYTAAKHPSYLWIAGGLILILVVGIIVFFVRRK